MRSDHDFEMLVDGGRAFDGHKRYRECENGFVELSAEFRDFLTQHDPTFNPQALSDDEITRLVRDPESALRWLPKKWVKEKGLTDAQVAQFPDIVPMGRWFRVQTWYDLQRYKMMPNSNRDKAFSNCYADADAVFLASYTGHLLTNDTGQRQAAIAIRPDIQIWGWDCKSRSLHKVR